MSPSTYKAKMNSKTIILGAIGTLAIILLRKARGYADMAQGGNKSAGLKGNFQQNYSYEVYQYFYHPDHLGSSSLITNVEELGYELCL